MTKVGKIVLSVLAAAWLLGCGGGGDDDVPAPLTQATAIPAAAPNASGATFPGEPTRTYPLLDRKRRAPPEPVDPFDPGPLVPPAPSGKPKGTTL